MSIEELEKNRKKTLLIIIAIPSASLLLCFIVLNDFGIDLSNILENFVPVYISIFGIFLSFIITKNFYNSFVDKVKKNLYKDILDSLFGNDYYYGRNESINESDIVETNSLLVPVLEGSDYIEASYNNIKFKMSDIKLIKVDSDSDGNSKCTIFTGQWMIFDFNKYFKSNIQVWEKALIGNIEKNRNFNLNKVEFEDIEFSNKFDIYAQNDLEAYYILTPNLIEKIKELEKELKGVLLLVFYNNRLHIGIKRNKDLFKVSIFKKIDLAYYKDTLYGDLSVVFKLIDLLNLNNSLFQVDNNSNTN